MACPTRDEEWFFPPFCIIKGEKLSHDIWKSSSSHKFFMGSQWDKRIILKLTIVLISYMRQLLSLNTHLISHSSANLTEYWANLHKRVNLLPGELKMFLNWNWLPNKKNTLRTWDNSARNLCRIPNAMLWHWCFSDMLRWMPSKKSHRYLLPVVGL